MVEHFIEMVAGSLRLKEQWFVESARFDGKSRRVDVFVAVRPEAEFACPECGGGGRNEVSRKVRKERKGERGLASLCVLCALCG